MKEVLKTAYTLWCLLLMIVFTFLACASFLGLLYAWGVDNDNAVYAAMFCICTFGWGMMRYNKIFIERVEKTKKATLNWDEDDHKDDDESDYND
jgi:hypothetical protein